MRNSAREWLQAARVRNVRSVDRARYRKFCRRGALAMSAGGDGCPSEIYNAVKTGF